MDQGNNNNKSSIAKTTATLAVGAAVGYGAYKLFESVFGSSEPETSHRMLLNSNRSEERTNYNLEPKSPPFSLSQKDVHVVDTIEKLRYSLKPLKSYVKESSFFIVRKTKFVLG